MAYEKRDNSGTLSRNTKKVTKLQPDHRGSCIVGGVEYWISAWVKDGEYGRFFSLAFQPKDVEPQSVGGLSPKDVDEDIPF
jgi:hypothetical protein